MTTRHNAMKANAGWWLSGRWLRAIIAAAGLCLLMLLTSCVRTETRYTNAPLSPVPASLLTNCPIPDIPEKFTWGDSLELNEKLLTSLQACNNDKAAIRQIERDRAEKSQEKIINSTP